MQLLSIVTNQVNGMQLVCELMEPIKLAFSRGNANMPSSTYTGYTTSHGFPSHNISCISLSLSEFFGGQVSFSAECHGCRLAGNLNG